MQVDYSLLQPSRLQPIPQGSQWPRPPYSSNPGEAHFYGCAQQNDPGGTWVFDDGYRPPTEETGGESDRGASRRCEPLCD